VPDLFPIRAYITHWLDAVDDHSIHSPFFFEFFKIVYDKNPIWGGDEIEEVRKKLLSNIFPIEYQELGSGKPSASGKEKLSVIANRSLAKPELASLYARIIKYLKAETVIELGTSLGITTLYLALRNEAQVITLEGNKAVADIAITNFEFFDKKNISVVHGNIDQTLKEALFNMRRVDFALVDANHRYEPTMRYFDLISKRVKEKSIVVIDDIHHSAEMDKAWNEIRKHELVYGSIDLFRCGILFFEPSLGKQHFVWELPLKAIVG
jgi:predicted O-methyltransferase YrrM